MLCRYVYEYNFAGMLLSAVYLPLWGIFQKASAHDDSRSESVFAAVRTGENPPGDGMGPEVAPSLTSSLSPGTDNSINYLTK